MPVSSEVLESCASLHDQGQQRIKMSSLWAISAHRLRGCCMATAAITRCVVPIRTSKMYLEISS